MVQFAGKKAKIIATIWVRLAYGFQKNWKGFQNHFQKCEEVSLIFFKRSELSICLLSCIISVSLLIIFFNLFT